MAKFCGNCGAASDDNANVCGNCGAPFATSSAKGGVGDLLAKIPGMNDIKPEQKALITKIAKIAIPAIAGVIVLLIVIFGFVTPNTGARGAMKKYFKAVQKGDSAAIVEMLPAYYKSEDLFGEDYDPEKELDDFFEDSDGNSVDSLEKKYGEGYKYKIKDMDVKKLDDDDLEDYEDLYDALVDANDDFEAPEISAGYKIKFELVLKGDKKDKDAKCTVYMIKEDGKWVVWDVETSVPGADPLAVLDEPNIFNFDYDDYDDYYDYY